MTATMQVMLFSTMLLILFFMTQQPNNSNKSCDRRILPVSLHTKSYEGQCTMLAANASKCFLWAV